jgi:hypothetical protein
VDGRYKREPLYTDKQASRQRLAELVNGANLRLVEGAYRLGVGKTYHPLETVLVGVAASGDWRKDVAATLGVEAPWVSGFLDGFGQRPESSTGAEYVQGYLTAEELRIARYRRDLPDRR